MAFIIKHFVDLFNYKFNIPSYQRGYRWEKKQIEDLLSDLAEFKNSCSENKSFYCLQPVVVTKNNNLSSKQGEDVYDLIDGQQRLTTLRLIFHQIAEMLPEDIQSQIYTIDYERNDTPIDDFFVDCANNTIKKWFKQHGAMTKAHIAEVLCPNPDHNEHDVRVIWYDVDEETVALYGSNMESVDIFNRLNYGKTSLTSTELIKALFFQCDHYPDSEKALRKQIAFSRSCEWDIMEKNLQNPFLWGMLGVMDYSSHIDVLLSFVVRRLLTENPTLGEYISDGKDYNYRVINNYIGNNPNLWGKMVDALWEKLQDSYVVITNWYSDHQWYHLVGLYVSLFKLRNKKAKDKEFSNLIFNLFQTYISLPKSTFTNHLKGLIGKEVKISSTISEKSIMYRGESDKGRKYGLHEICYNECNQDLIRILLLLNVDISLHDINERMCFPFHLFHKCKTTSLEHIHPQNLSLEGIAFDELCTWFQRKEQELNRIGQADKMSEYLEVLKNAKKEMENDKKWFDNDNNRISCQKAVTAIDAYFNELAKMDERLMHSIQNMALVDKDTNAALQNYMIDKKRKILKERERHDQKNPVMVPIATKMVFNKAFTASPTDLKFWTEEDRNAYFSEIKRVYEEYINLI